ncbi:MAG: cell wall-active antibiotics response protein [bacterium]|nr:cell wall-active antibiotics response protein [bacterium]
MTDRKNSSSGTQIAGFILISLGIIFILKEFIGFNLFGLIGDLWPLVLIFVGWYILKRSRPSGEETSNEEQQETKQADSEKGYDTITGINLIGDTSIRFTSKNFQGGNGTSIIGSTHINLSEIDFPPGEKEIKLTNIIGDIHITLPKDFAIKARGNTVIGKVKIYDDISEGFFRNVFYRADNYSKQEKRLHIDVSSIIGEIFIT